MKRSGFSRTRGFGFVDVELLLLVTVGFEEEEEDDDDDDAKRIRIPLPLLLTLILRRALEEGPPLQSSPDRGRRNRGIIDGDVVAAAIGWVWYGVCVCVCVDDVGCRTGPLLRLNSVCIVLCTVRR